MHIDVQGSGPDLVLIHGWAMHGGIFSPLTDLLTTHFRVHAVDLPGHGDSRGDTHFDLADCARRIAAATPRALWIGWSLGGLVALRAALDQPTNVRGLALIASSPRFVSAPDWPHGVAASVFAEFGAELQSRYRHAVERFLALETMGSTHAQTELRNLKKRVFERGDPDPGALADGLRALDDSDLRADLAHLAMPSLWIAGRRDRLVAPAAMVWSAQQARCGRYLEFNSGHAPFISHAAEIAAAIGAFAAALPA
jgi:pimeloyl-[acyl-carrier protein] methyl ester esterase